MIRTITTEELRRMDDREGIIFQGCGGNPHDWLNGVNDLLTKEGILLNGSRFENAFVFQHEGSTNILFDFDKTELNIGKLAMWRIQTHGTFGGRWLSDYVPNRLGGFIFDEPAKVERPDCELIGQDGNIFNLIGIASRTLRRNGMEEQAQEMCSRITGGGCHSYDDALCIIGEYVNIIGPENPETDMKMGGM